MEVVSILGFVGGAVDFSSGRVDINGTGVVVTTEGIFSVAGSVSGTVKIETEATSGDPALTVGG